MPDDFAADYRLKKVLWYRWLIWAVLGLAYIVVYFHRVSPAVVAGQLMSEFGVSAAVLGNLGAMYFYIYTVMQVPSGLLADSLGARNTVSLGLLVAAAGSAVFGLSGVLGVAFAGRFLVGLGLSVIFISIMKVQAGWFYSHEFGTLSGLTMFVGNIGAVLAATPLALLADRVGWRLAFVHIGAVTFLFAVLGYLLIRNRPADMNLPELEESLKEGTGGGKLGERLLTVFRNKHTWPPFLVFFGVYGTLMTFSAMWGIPYLMQVYGLDRSAASRYTLVLAVGIMIGSPVVGIISDQIKKRKLPFMLFTLAYTSVWLTLAGSGMPPLGLMYAIAFALGFFGSAFILTWACAKEVNPPDIAGLATGTANAGGFLGAALTQVIFGYALDLRWQSTVFDGARVFSVDAYQFAFIISLIPLLVAIVGILLLKETNCRNIFREIINEKQ